MAKSKRKVLTVDNLVSTGAVSMSYIRVVDPLGNLVGHGDGYMLGFTLSDTPYNVISIKPAMFSVSGTTRLVLEIVVERQV